MRLRNYSLMFWRLIFFGIFTVAVTSNVYASGSSAVPAKCSHPAKNNPESKVKVAIFARTVDSSKVGATVELPAHVDSLGLTDSYVYQVSSSTSDVVCVNEAVSKGLITIDSESKTLSVGDRLIYIQRQKRDYGSYFLTIRTELIDIATSVISGGSTVDSCENVQKDDAGKPVFPENVRCIWPYVLDRLDGKIVKYLFTKSMRNGRLIGPSEYLSSELCEIELAKRPVGQREVKHCVYINSENNDLKCAALHELLITCPLDLGNGYELWKDLRKSDPEFATFCSSPFSPIRKFDQEDYDYHELSVSSGGLPACQ